MSVKAVLFELTTGNVIHVVVRTAIVHMLRSSY